MRRLLSLSLAVFLVGGVAAVADAAPLKWVGTLEVEFGTLATFNATGTGVATVNGSGGGLHLNTLRLTNGISGATSVPVTDPEVTAVGITSVRVTATLGTGTLGAISGGGPLSPSTLPVLGLALVCLSDPECNPAANAALSIPLHAGPSTGVGIGGLLTGGGLGGNVRISIIANPWTIGTAKAQDQLDGGTTITVTRTGFAHGPASLTLSTAQPSGVVKFVTPVQISTNIPGSNEKIAVFGTLKLHFVPEPGMLLLLGAGAVGLVILGRHRMQR